MPISKGKESKQVWSEMDVARLMKDAQFAEQAGHPRRALDLVNKAFSVLAELHPQLSGERRHLYWGRARANTPPRLQPRPDRGGGLSAPE